MKWDVIYEILCTYTFTIHNLFEKFPSQKFEIDNIFKIYHRIKKMLVKCISLNSSVTNHDVLFLHWFATPSKKIVHKADS